MDGRGRLLKRLEESVRGLWMMLGEGEISVRKDEEGGARLEGGELHDGEDLFAEGLDGEVPRAFFARPKDAQIGMGAAIDAFGDLAIALTDDFARERHSRALFSDSAWPFKEIGGGELSLAKGPAEDSERRVLTLDIPE